MTRESALHTTPREAVDPHTFRTVMSRFASGVTVITADDDRGDPRAMTVNAFISGSLDPPLCVVSIARRANMHAVLAAAGRFAVNVLSREQVDVAMHFGGRPRPGLRPHFARILGVPVLTNVAAEMVAERVAAHECGDHTLFVGRLMHMAADETRPPLVYHARRFGRIVHEGEAGDEAVAVLEFW